VKVREELVTVVTVWAFTVLVKVYVGEEAVTVVTLQFWCPRAAKDAETPTTTDNATIPTIAMTAAISRDHDLPETVERCKRMPLLRTDLLAVFKLSHQFGIPC
jgi:hypothetical protein